MTLFKSFILVILLAFVTSCDNKDKPIDEPMQKGIIMSYNEYGGAMLDITEADMKAAGFTLGDVICITVDGKKLVMPYYDGYYTPNGELVCVAYPSYPSYPSICFTANNIGLPQELQGLEGHAVTVWLKEKGGCIDVQKALGMTYINNRSDYPDLTDTEFANARIVSAGNIACDMLHRRPFSVRMRNN